MRILGIIAEYNPFHLGHAWHLEQAKAAVQPDLTVICLSGPFVQRGEAALFSPAARAEMALAAGADLVVEMPCLFACREAEFFARGGVSMLQRLGCTHLAFGAESADAQLLQMAADLIAADDSTYIQHLRDGLEGGLSFAAAQGNALSACLNKDFNAPNNALALAYLQELKQFPMIPVIIPRKGSYHDPNAPGADALPSATAVRRALLAGDVAGAQTMCPESVWPILLQEWQAKHVCPPDALDKPLGLALLNATGASLRRLPSIAEGLEDRLLKCASAYTSRTQLLETLKTRRYTYTRLSRLLCHTLLGMEADLCRQTPLPPYARLLGFRASAQSYLNQVKKGPVPLLTKAARWDADDPVFRLDMRAYDLWALGAGLPLGLGWRQSPIILP